MTTPSTTPPPTATPGPDFSNVGGGSSSDYGSGVWEVPDAVTNNQVPVTRDPWASVARSGQRGAIHTQLGSDVLHQFNYMTPADRTKLQIQLVLTGYDTRPIKKIKFGQADPGSYTAYSNAVVTAARSGKPLSELLGAGGDPTLEALGQLAASENTHVNIIQHHSDADVQLGMVKGFQAAIGRAPTPQEAAAFNAAYRGQETAAQPDTSGGGDFVVNDPGDPTIAAEFAARQHAPALAAGHDRIQAFGTMLSSLGFKG